MLYPLLLVLVVVAVPVAISLRYRSEWAKLPGERTTEGDGAYRSGGVLQPQGGGVPPFLLAAASVAVSIGVLLLLHVGFVVVAYVLIAVAAAGLDGEGFIGGVLACGGLPFAVLGVGLVRLGLRVARPGRLGPKDGGASLVGLGLLGVFVAVYAAVTYGQGAAKTAVTFGIAVTCLVAVWILARARGASLLFAEELNRISSTRDAERSPTQS